MIGVCLALTMPFGPAYVNPKRLEKHDIRCISDVAWTVATTVAPKLARTVSYTVAHTVADRVAYTVADKTAPTVAPTVARLLAWPRLLPCAQLSALVVLVVCCCRMVGSGIGSDWIGGE